MTERLQNISATGLFIRTANSGRTETVLRSNDTQLIRTTNGMIDISPVRNLKVTNSIDLTGGSLRGDINFTGRVGIGSTTPTEKLDVDGNADFTGTVTAGEFVGSGVGLTALGSIGTHSDVDTTTTPPTNGSGLFWDSSTSMWIPGTGASGALDGLTDVDVSTTAPTTNQALIWDGSNWVAGIPAMAINDLSDVDTTTTAPVDLDVLTWDNATTTWVPRAAASTWTVTGTTINYAGGNVGIGSATPTVALDVVGDINTTTQVVAAGTTLTFTGQHKNVVTGIHNGNVENFVGLIVSANKNEYININNGIVKGRKAISIDESLPVLSLSNKDRDSSCFGVVSSKEGEFYDTDTNESKRTSVVGGFVTAASKEDGDDRVVVNSLGEGAMWVTNKNGPLRSGDYITTSSVPGYGMKQDSEFLANYTVAKITMDCNFDPMTKHVQKIKKVVRAVQYYRHSIPRSDVTELSKFMTIKEKCVPKEDVLKMLMMGEQLINDDVVRVEETPTQIRYFEIMKNNGFELSDDYFIKDIPVSTYNQLSKVQKINYSPIRKSDESNLLDANGQLIWENTPELEKAYDIRYVNEHGVQLTKEAYLAKKAANQPAYISAFVGVTYHCG